jgi:hypothetical protein
VAWRKIWHVLQFGLGALLVGLAVRSIVVNWQSLKAQPIDWQLSPVWLAASIAVVFGAYAVLVEAWRRVVISMGPQLRFGTAARIWFLASLGKYIPGKVWALAGTAALAQRAGVDPSTAVAGAIVLQALALASGAAVVAWTSDDALQAVGPELAPVAGTILLVSLIGIALLASRSAVDRVNRLLPRVVPRLRSVNPAVLVTGFAANILAWTAYGLSLLFLARGLFPDIGLDLSQAVGVFTCAYLAGFIALFAPAGLGPRESVFLLLLAGDIGLKPAAGLALASRILLTGAEVLPAVPLLLRRQAGSPSSVREA